MTNPILDRILELVSDGLHPHVVAAELVNGEWRGRIELDDWTALGEAGDNLAVHAVTIDRSQIPPGVAVSGKDRWPPQIVILPAVTRSACEQWIREIAKVGSAPDYAWSGDCCLTKPIRWMREPLRSALAGKYKVTLD